MKYATPPSRRIGKFNIDRHIIDNSPHDAVASLEGCIVLRAECMAHTGMYEYFAIHPDFEEVPVGMMIPEYHAVIISGRRIWEKRTDEG